jgi:hypothetical protein
MPWLKNLPNADWIIGVQIEGLKALQAKEKGKSKSGKAAVVPSSPSRQQLKPLPLLVVPIPGVPCGNEVSQAQVEALRQHLSKKGGVTTQRSSPIPPSPRSGQIKLVKHHVMALSNHLQRRGRS